MSVHRLVGRRMAPVLAIALLMLAPFLLSPTVHGREPVRAGSDIEMPAGGTEVYGDITADTTWTLAGSPYLLMQAIEVYPAATLTIEPGVVVKGKQNAGYLVVNGRLIAQGTLAEPILFTGEVPSPGSWQGVKVVGQSADFAEATLDYVTVEYGGISSSGANLYINLGVVTMTHSVVRHGGMHGVDTNSSGVIHASDSAFMDNSGYAIRFVDARIHPVLRRLTATGNGVNGVGLGASTLLGSNIWENAGIPYVPYGSISIDRDATLLIEPGTEVRFAPDTRFDVRGILTLGGTPAAPVRLLGQSDTPGAWRGVDIYTSGRVFMQHCELGYGGAVQALLRTQSNNLYVRDCRIHHSAAEGIMVNGDTFPYLRYNEIEDNAFGVRNSDPLVPEVDARYNWWGSVSGPFHATNPAGQGNAVSDGVLFDPWLPAPGDAPAGGLEVQIVGADTFAPGSVQPYAVPYLNASNQAIENAVLAVTLPANATLLDTSGGAIHWPERRQIFWRLGTVAAGAGGVVSFHVHYDWGLPFGIRDAALAQLSGSNVVNPEFDVQPYLAYVPTTVQQTVPLTQAQVQAEAQVYPEFGTLYTEALAEGYRFGIAHRLTLSSGAPLTRVVLLKPAERDFVTMILTRQEDRASAMVVAVPTFEVRKAGGAIRYNALLGSWEESSGAAATRDGLSIWSDCMTNCVMEQVPGYGIRKALAGVDLVMKGHDCVQAFQSGDKVAITECAADVLDKVPAAGEGIALGKCNYDCQNCDGTCEDEQCHCCTEDRRSCESGGFWGWLGRESISHAICSKETGRYLPGVETEVVCPWCEKCVLSGGVPICMPVNSMAERLALVGPLGGSRFAAPPPPTTARATRALTLDSSGGTCPECQPAHDPNAKIGVAGDLVPGQLVTYTISIENMGTGTAYDVFVVDALSDSFDLLSVNAPAASSPPGSATLVWWVGDLAPHGQPGATAEVTFTVRLRTDVAAGTVVTNQAIVHFPSVPELTPTDTVVNIVQPVAAVPQHKNIVAGQAVGVTLAGRGPAGVPLTFTVVEPPLYGVLTGTPPNVTYTPMSEYVGQDVFRYVASGSGMTSRPAEVTIESTPSPNDTQRPTVEWTFPADGSSVEAPQEPRFADDGGFLYAPGLLVQFSEAMAPATINTSTIRLVDSDQQAVSLSVRYDGARQQAIAFPRQPLAVGTTYTATVTRGVTDVRGNAMAADVLWQFTTTGAPSGAAELYLPLVQKQATGGR